jgi:DNA repair protein RadC
LPTKHQEMEEKNILLFQDRHQVVHTQVLLGGTYRQSLEWRNAWGTGCSRFCRA